MDVPVLVDSSVLIDWLRAGMDPAIELLNRRGCYDLATCGIVKAEVLRGMRWPKQRDQLAGFFAVMQFVEMDGALWDWVIETAWGLDRKGWVIPLPDIVIAACATRAGAVLLTRDDHFDRIPGLRIARP